MPVYCPAPCGVPRTPTANRGRQGAFAYSACSAGNCRPCWVFFVYAVCWIYYSKYYQTVKSFQPLEYKALLAFLPQKDEVENFLILVFQPYVFRCGSSGECRADVLRDTGFLLLLFCPSDTGHFLYEIALLLCRCISGRSPILSFPDLRGREPRPAAAFRSYTPQSSKMRTGTHRWWRIRCSSYVKDAHRSY